MSDTLTLEILTPARQVLKTEAAGVTLPGIMGELGILPEHVPLVTQLASGLLSYEANGQRRYCAVHYGYARVEDDHITVLCEMAEPIEEINLERARSAEGKAREELNRLLQTQEAEELRLKKYEAKLHRAMVRQQRG